MLEFVFLFENEDFLFQVKDYILYEILLVILPIVICDNFLLSF